MNTIITITIAIFHLLIYQFFVLLTDNYKRVFSKSKHYLKHFYVMYGFRNAFHSKQRKSQLT